MIVLFIEIVCSLIPLICSVRTSPALILAKEAIGTSLFNKKFFVSTITQLILNLGTLVAFYFYLRGFVDYENILNSSNEKIEFNNSIFLDPKKKRLKRDIDKSNISLVIFEIMKFIFDSFNVDYIIKIKYDNIAKKINLDEVEVIKPEEFNRFDATNDENKKIGIERGYLKPAEFSLCYYDLSESKNQLIREPLQNSEEKDMSTTIRKMNTESGNFSDHSNIINKLEENGINQINKIEEKNDDKKKNKGNKADNSEEMDVEELNENEKNSDADRAVADGDNGGVGRTPGDRGRRHEGEG